MFATYRIGLFVKRWNVFNTSTSSALYSRLFTQSPSPQWLTSFSRRSASNFNFLSPLFAKRFVLSNFLSSESKSESNNSVSIISASLTGSTDPLTCTIPESSKHLTTWIIADVSLIWPKNLFPNPSPLFAPWTNPAISMNSTVAGITFSSRQFALWQLSTDFSGYSVIGWWIHTLESLVQ